MTQGTMRVAQAARGVMLGVDGDPEEVAEKVKLSICMPYWQRQESLDAMFAMYERLYADLPIEFSICDDGDPVPAQVPKDWFPAEPWAQYVCLSRLPAKDRPRNPCVPINKAVAESTGEIIVLTNPEVEHYQPILKEMLGLITGDDDYVMAQCRAENGAWLAGPEVGKDGRNRGRSPTPPGGYFHFLTMFRRKLWDKVGGFDEDYRDGQACDDNDWLWRLYEADAQFKVTTSVVVHAHIKRISWNMPHNRDLFAKKWSPARRNEVIQEREKREGQRLYNAYLLGELVDDPKNPRYRVRGEAEGDAVIHGAKDGRGVRTDGVVAVSGDAKRESVGPTQSGEQFGGTTIRDDGTKVVERVLRISRRDKDDRARGSRRRRGREPTRDGSATTPPVRPRPEGRRPGLVHPEWALVLGGGPDVWEEVLGWEKIYGKQWDGVVVAANDVGSHWPRHLDHWVSLHPDKFEAWGVLRAKHGFNQDYDTWGRKARFAGRTVAPWAGGASGMLAIQVAQQVGCVRVILCGVPMTATPHFTESAVHVLGQPWKAVEGHWRAWQKHVAKVEGWVKSMSGRTAELLGEPTMEWLLEGAVEPESHEGLSEFEQLAEMAEER